MRIRVETPRLILREFVAGDFGALLELDTDPEVMRFISDGRPRTEEEVRGFLEGCMAAYDRNPGFGFWAALERAENSFVGWFHFRPDRSLPNHIEVGYRLSRDAWGRGLATEGVRALIEGGFARDVEFVSGRAMKANIASIHVLKKAGLEFVEEYQEERFPGEDKTAALFSRTRD